jgi:hypothetical protein
LYFFQNSIFSFGRKICISIGFDNLEKDVKFYLEKLVN